MLERNMQNSLLKVSKEARAKKGGRVPVGKGGSDKLGGVKDDQSKRLFATMMSDKNFKTNFNFNMESANVKLPGPTVEEIDEDDLD